MNDLDATIDLLEEMCPCEACERLRRHHVHTNRLTVGHRIQIYVEKLRKALGGRR